MRSAVAAVRGAAAVTSAADCLPGVLVIGRGMAADYRLLEQFHYARGRPATWAGVWRAEYRDRRWAIAEWRSGDGVPTARLNHRASHIGSRPSRVVGVAVLSWPTLSCRPRERVLGLRAGTTPGDVDFVNANVRTISRVIVHPQFRSLGVAVALVRRVLSECPTRYVEAVAAMGEVHPLFERAGMRKVTPQGDRGGAAYFIFDRKDREERA